MNMPWFQNVLELWTKQGSEYVRVTQAFIKYFMIDVWQYSEYAWVPNLLGLQVALDKSLHHRYPVSQGSLENDLSYMFDRVLSIPRVLIMVRLEYARVANISWLHRIRCKLYLKSSRYWECILDMQVLDMLKFWMYQESKYTIVTKDFE